MRGASTINKTQGVSHETEKRTVLITGGTSGIGLELARQLHKRGNTVIVTGRDREKLDAANRALSGVHTFKSDVSDPGAIAALHDSVLAQFPTLDTLVNNAGIMRNLNLNQDRDLNDVTREIEINFKADGEDGEAQEVTRPPIKGISTSSQPMTDHHG
jgi:short-subunit dehydrogenase involved in D-alanine esterification of teichoic acids